MKLMALLDYEGCTMFDRKMVNDTDAAILVCSLYRKSISFSSDKSTIFKRCCVPLNATTVDNNDFNNKVYKPNGRMLKMQLRVWSLDDAVIPADAHLIIIMVLHQ